MCRNKLSEIKFARSLEEAKNYAIRMEGYEGFDHASANCQCGESAALAIYGAGYELLGTVVICEACYEQYEDNRVF